MMKKKTYRIIWGLCLITTATLGCGLFSGLTEDLREIRNTGEAVATQVGGMVTQAVGLATAVDENPVMQTAQAMITEIGPGIISSAQAFATQVHESGFLLTAQAKATEGVSLGQAPGDIPLPEEQYLVNFIGSEHIISFNTPLELHSMIDLYIQGMPLNGWIELPEERVLEDTSAVLVYAKDDRLARIALNVIPVDKSTIVFIIVQED
ncbi:MAG: hypothetical protein ACNA8H_02125 [Anaerolineales bacterium]